MHDHIQKLTGEQTGRAGAQIVATLAGGVLLACSLLAEFVFPEKFHAGSLACVAAILLGLPLLHHAIQGLWHGHSHMDELAALAFLAAFAQGAAGLVPERQTGYYQTAGAIAFFMLITALIESRTALGARASIESLIRLTPTRAQKITPEGETEVEAQDLRPGDRVRVRPGDRIPGDGTVLSGSSTVNQAPITGESLPVDKAAGDEVFGGAVNLTGVLEIEITKAGKDTTLGRVQELILQAEQSRIPLARLVDRYAHWYTPTVLMVAAIVLVFTRNLEQVIGILIAACPCALVMATPTAMVAALSAAARLGVLVKNVTDLEAARRITAIVFDKTGTLTTGQLSVTRLRPAPGVDGADLLRAAALAEQGSRHPVAKAVLETARRARLTWPEPETFEELAGKGVRAVAGGTEVLVGRASWLESLGLRAAGLDEAGAEGLSLLHVARGGQVLGWIALEDRTRPEAARALDDLRELGVKQLIMVTGDRESVARRVAAEMHCTDVQAQVLPAQKLELVDRLKRQGHTVAVIGDGVNDAPALAAGDISIAMGAAGSDVAIHSASIALMNDRLNRIPFLVRLSRHTVRVVRQNMLFGVAFMLLMLASTAYLAPFVVAALHTVAELVVLFNSARLVREGEDLDHVPAGGEGGVPPPQTVPVTAAAGN